MIEVKKEPSFDQILKKNRQLKFCLAVVMVLSLFLTLALTDKRQEISLGHGQKAKDAVTASTAPEPHHISWGMYVASKLGNSGYEDADSLKQTLSWIVSPSIYDDFNQILAGQIAGVKQEKVTYEFSPKKSLYESKSGKVFVTGYVKTQSGVGDPSKKMKTFETKFTFENYQPQLVWIDVYQGNGRTEKELRRLESMHKKDTD